MGLQSPAVHFTVHRRQIHQQVQNTLLDKLVHEGDGEVGGVGVGPRFGAFGVVVGQGSHHQRRRPRSIGQGLEAVDVHHEVFFTSLRRHAGRQTREVRCRSAKQGVHGMNDRRDVPQAFRVGAMAMGLNRMSRKFTEPPSSMAPTKPPPRTGVILGESTYHAEGLGPPFPTSTVLKSTGRVKSARCAMPFHSKRQCMASRNEERRHEGAFLGKSTWVCSYSNK